MWSFVSNKDNKQWVWLAEYVNTKEIVGVYVGSGSRSGARGLWQSLQASVPPMCGLRLQISGQPMSR